MAKMFLIDTTRCTACRGCQIACKEWKQLPATATKQTGSHQNPPDLNGSTLKLVRFSENKIKGRVVWNFFSDQCRHCITPPCKDAAESYVPGAIVQDAATGDGPIDAICRTMDRITGTAGKLCDYKIRAITSGKDALGEVTVEVEFDGVRLRARAVSTDVIEASAKAYLNAINRHLMKSRKQKTK